MKDISFKIFLYNKMQNNDYIVNLLKSEDEQLNKLHQIVANALKEEELVSQNLYQTTKESLKLGDRVSDKVASFGGSWTFIIIFGIVLFLWILTNTYLLRQKSFDPFPFIFLNLILSCIAAIQAPVIMMSQNRKEEIDRKRAENDYLVNLKAEIEIRNLHQKLDLLIVEQMKNLFEIQKEQVDLLLKIEEKINKK